MEAHVGKLTATPRAGLGKIEVRKLRHQGLIPAVVYGRGEQSRALTVDPKHLHAALDPQRKANTLIELSIESKGQASEQLNVMLHDYQYHPISRQLLHADFITVALDKPVQVKVPLTVEGRAKGVQMGGLINQVFRTVPVECTPAQVPAVIVVDVSELDIGDSVQVSQLPLPEGVRPVLPAEQTVVLCVGGRGAGEDTEEETGEEAGEEAEAAATPAE